LALFTNARRLSYIRHTSYKQIKLTARMRPLVSSLRESWRNGWRQLLPARQFDNVLAFRFLQRFVALHEYSYAREQQLVH